MLFIDEKLFNIPYISIYMNKSIKKSHPYIYWTPRIISILFILFLALFSLDVFDGNSSPKEIIIGLFMHNLPSIILAIVLIFAWKKELVGTIAFLFAAILFIIFTVYRNMVGRFDIIGFFSSIIIISGPALIISYLFYLNYKLKKK